MAKVENVIRKVIIIDLQRNRVFGGVPGQRVEEELRLVIVKSKVVAWSDRGNNCIVSIFSKVVTIFQVYWSWACNVVCTLGAASRRNNLVGIKTNR